MSQDVEVQDPDLRRKALNIAAELLDSYNFQSQDLRELTREQAPLGVLALKLMGLTPVDAEPPLDYPVPPGNKHHFVDDRQKAWYPLKQACPRCSEGKLAEILNALEVRILTYKRDNAQDTVTAGTPSSEERVA